jgi:hypothetical protein
MLIKSSVLKLAPGLDETGLIQSLVGSLQLNL